jgi:hypothetical protein
LFFSDHWCLIFKFGFPSGVSNGNDHRHVNMVHKINIVKLYLLNKNPVGLKLYNTNKQ